MAQRTNAIDRNGAAIKVGTIGTIGSLMTRELECTKHSDQTCPPMQRKQQTAPVSIHCGANSRKTLQKRNQTNEHGSSSRNDSGSSTGHANGAPRRNGPEIPMLVTDGSLVDQHPNTDKAEKKAHSYIVEVVDLKCSNPMSTRLKKLGFSKLSESIS
ncbi:hypothetical protein ZIOFF_061110 [Zingiber officinale]|nr:hypothetical protein ZIOFF_061110 [Zingiber officinale]